LTEPLDIQGQVARTGRAAVLEKPGIGVEPDRDFLKAFEINA